MSAKWRALQHRHRYTYSAVVFPQSYTDALTELHIDHAPSSKYYSELKELVALNSTYAQVNHAKRVASAFGDVLVNGTEDLVSEAARFYLEILFLENSLPLHRTLVSVLAKSRNFHSLIANCFRLLCDEYGGVNGKGKRFCVSRVALSLMNSPKLGYLVEIIESCAVLVALDAVSGLDYIVSETNDWSRPSPIVMEQCQEALSCMYYLLQRFPSKFNGSNFSGSDLLPDDSNILRMIFATILSILKSQAFSRDCFVAAGVSFCAAFQACLGPEELGCAIMEGIFFQKNCSLVVCSCNEVKGAISKVPFKGDLCFEIRNFSVLSRLCLIRGILTAVPRTVLNIRFLVSTYDVNGFHANGGKGNTVQTILYDGILPELCRNCENPTDSHVNFHALTVLQICLQQIKTSIQANLCETSKDYDPISEDMGTRILSIIWNNLEDPLSQTVKQVHLIFDLFLDIQSTLHWSKGSEGIKLSLERIASDLLHLGPRCKGRYVPLASLTKRLGAKTILDMNSNLLFETIKAYNDDDVCCAATTFLKCFLECLRDEYWSSDGIETGYAKYRGHCLPPVLSGLASGISKLRSNLNTYALPVLLELDVGAIFPMLAFVSVGQGDTVELVYPELSYTCMPLRVEQQVAILVSLLKVSRLLALIEGDIDWCESFSESQKAKDPRVNKIDHFAVFCIKGIKVKILTEWLVLALTHVDESLRIDAAESLFLNPKTSSLPSHLELSLMKEAVPLNMRCCSTAFQMKWGSMFRKFFSRVRTALERQIKQGVWQPLAYCDSNGVSPYKGAEETTVNKAENLFNFMKWMSSFLFFSCYPSAPYERKIMAMELILIMINVWSIIPPSQGKSDSNTSDPSLCPYDQGFTLPDSTLLLVGSVIDSWDRLRENSFHILLHFPTPLPGIYSSDMVQKIIKWAKELVCSPRVRESDAGALTLRLIFRKYVLELGWMVRPLSNFVSFYSHSEMLNGDVQNSSSSSPVMEYVRSLIDWLHVSVEEGEKDLPESCKKSFVHGVLLTLRYTFEELDWNSRVVLSNLCEMRLALENLLQLIMRTTSLALWVVSADAWYLCEDMDDMVDNDVFLSEVPVGLDVSVSALEHDMNSKLVRDVRQEVRQSEQIVMVGCWLAMKEVSLLLGTIIRKIPLPTSDSLKPGDPFPDAVVTLIMESDIVLDLKQLETIGNHFLEVLLKMKHNGAIDKTRAGFTALCNRLLCSNDPRLCKLTESWMEQLMERTVAKGQTVDDLLRRSAGIPAAFIALFLSEPEGTPKRLLPRALRWLIEVANKSLLDWNYFDTDSSNSLSIKSNQPNVLQLSSKMDASERTSKIRDEGVVPTVHAFNVLRATFNDTNLATDTSGFAAETLIISIRSFSSTYWEVRNSACLAYTALVRRMIGFLNIQKRDSARRALTGLEFFHRYPSLHPFLFNELRVATELLNDNSPQHPESNLAKVVHPSLCPMLILLSRLKPSAIASETGDNLDPFLFMPFIRRCSIQSNYRIRVLASRALTGLVSNEKLPIVLLDIASGLPCTESQMVLASDSFRPVSMNDEKPTVSLNSIHGTLLQMISLLEINCMNLADFSNIDQIIGDLIQVLVMRSWIGRPRLCPCPTINSSFLRVLDNMLSIARMFQMSKNIGPIWNLLWELSSECLDLEAAQGVPYYDPTIVEFRNQGTVSYFNCVFKASKDDAEENSPMQQQCFSPALHFVMIPESEDAPSRFQQRLILSMSDASYEVRIATLKWLLVFLKATESGMGPSDKSMAEISIAQWFKTNLQTTLMKLLVTEKNKKCTYYILRILFTWNLLQFQKPGSFQCGESVYIGEMDCDSVLQFWSKLVSLYELTRHVKTRETIICCLGICMKRFADIFTSLVISNLEMKTTFESSKSDQVGRLAQMYDCVAFYVYLIDQHSASSEPVNMRRAAAESLLASGLLEQAGLIGPLVLNSRIPSENPSTRFEPEEAVNMYGHKILDIWFACIKLLEDEDVGLRRKLAKDVQKCFALKRSGEISKSAAVPSQVEKVTELSFEHLSSVFGNWLEYFNYLAQWVLNTANSVISTGNLVRRVFDKEIDNHHEEKLLICQICCSHLEKLPVSGSWAVDFSDKQGIGNFLHTWRTRFRNQLMSFANNHIGSQGEVDWIGSVGNHKDAFLPLYANLLGFYALSNCVFLGESGNGKSLLADVVELGEAISPFLRNPLIMNLYLLVVKSHEKMLGASPGHLIGRFGGEGSTWHGFDPYFLLR